MSRKRYTLLGAAVAALLLLASTAAGGQIAAGNTGWLWSNPLPQGASLNRLSVFGSRVWAGGAMGTLIRSDDGGRNWSSVRTGLLDDLQSVEAISSESVVFAGRCALRRSDDAGVTVRRLAWRVAEDGCPSRIRGVSFASSQVGYLLLADGELYATSDGGSHWDGRGAAPLSPSAGGIKEPRDIFFTSASDGLVSIAGRIYRTTDGAASWKQASAPPVGAQPHDFDFIDAERGFAASADGQVLFTKDGGATWQDAALGGTAAYPLTGIDCEALACVAGAAAGGPLMRTVDGGASWSPLDGPGGQVLTVAFTSGSSLLAAGAGGLLALSSDAGLTWKRVDLRAAGAFGGLHVDSPRSAVAFGPGGVLARTSDAGGSWQRLPAPGAKDLIDAAAVGNDVLALEDSGSLLHSPDGGLAWLEVESGVKEKPSAILLWPGGRTSLVARGGLFTSRDWGANARRARGSGGSRLTGADPAGRAAFAYGARQIYATRDRGRSWRVVRGPRGAGRIVGLDMLDSRHGYLLDSEAEIFATADGGRRWRRIEGTGANQAVSIAFGDLRHGYLGDQEGRILATRDGGRTWERQYPFYDGTAKSPLVMAGLSGSAALALVRGSERIFSTASAGRAGQDSRLTIRPAARSVRRGSVVPVTGSLSPAVGGERVSVLARAAGAVGGTRWSTQDVTVSPKGTFITKWKVTTDTVFIARWSGDAARDGDAAPLMRVRLRR